MNINLYTLKPLKWLGWRWGQKTILHSKAQSVSQMSDLHPALLVDLASGKQRLKQFDVVEAATYKCWFFLNRTMNSRFGVLEAPFGFLEIRQ